MADELLRVMAFDGRARAVVAETTDAVERLRSIHTASPTVTAALGRVATGALLLAASVEKVAGREPVLTVRVAGNGLAGSFLATASPAGWLRAIVDRPQAAVPPRADGKLDVRAVVGGSGTLEVARDSGTGIPYNGIVPIVSGEIAEDFAHYLSESEQVPSAVGLGVHVVPEPRVSHAGGFLVQLLPGLSEDEVEAIERRVDEVGAVTARLREGAALEDLVARIFPSGCQILERTPVRFECGCSAERVERAVKLLGAAEIQALIRQSLHGPVALTCNFCREAYRVPEARLRSLLCEVRDETGGRSPVAQA